MSITDTQISRLMTRAGQNFEVGTVEIRNPFNGKPIGDYIVYRKDTKECIRSGVKGSYTPIQNMDANAKLQKISEVYHIKLINGLVLGDSCMMTVAKFGTDITGKFKVGGGDGRGRADYVEKRIVMLNGHDGRISNCLLARPTIYPIGGMVPVQLNGLPSWHPMANLDLLNTRHTKRSQEEELDVGAIVSDTNELFEEIAKFYRQLVDTELVGSHLDTILQQIFPQGNGISPKMVTTSKASTRAVMEMFYSVEPNKQNTLWNIYRAICIVLQQSPVRVAATVDSHQMSVVDGNIYRYCQDALDAVAGPIQAESDVEIKDVFEMRI